MTYTEKVEFLEEVQIEFDKLQGLSAEKIFAHLIDTYGKMARAEKGIDTFNYAEVEWCVMGVGSQTGKQVIAIEVSA